MFGHKEKTTKTVDRLFYSMIFLVDIQEEFLFRRVYVYWKKKEKKTTNEYYYY